MFKKILCSLIVFSILATQVISFPVASAVGIPVVYDLVTIVIDTDFDKDSYSYIGLIDKFPGELSEATIGGRIMRYSQDIIDNNDLTDVKILFFDKEKDSVEGLSVALESLYVNDGLSGVVLVGDIPLPVVNKNGNKFVSMFPYTDFEDKSYIYNSATDTFERNEQSPFPKPEIWHGVISAPESGIVGKEKLAEFFDKNHLYYSGVPEYSEFDKKIFFGDLVHEEEKMNSDVYQYYLKYIEAWEDISYMRYNKAWADELMGEIAGDIPINEANPDAVEFGAALKNGSATDGMPDGSTKNIIGGDENNGLQGYLRPYYAIFSNYLSKLNDFVEGTGRYETSDVDSIPVLISEKDAFTRKYIKMVNDEIEKQVNEVVEKIQEPIPLLMLTKLSGEFADGEGDGSHTYFRYHYENETTGDFYINGVSADVLESAKQCGLYLGSSNLTEATRSNDMSTAMPLNTAGVHSRPLSEDEASSLTGGEVEYGAVVEDYPEYGISAFIDNPLTKSSLYKNPFENFLKKGDVIASVNGVPLKYNYTFDMAIEASYKAVKKVVDAVNNKELEKLEGFEYPIAVYEGEKLSQADLKQAVGNMGIEYYRGSERFQKNITFTVSKAGLTTKNDAEGDPEIIVLLSRIGYPSDINDFPDELFEDNSAGAIFTLYNTDIQGFSNGGYDNSAGCNANSTRENKDRCFAMVATMPVLDPAGAVLVDAGDWADADVDEVIYDSCFAGLPSVVALQFDSNPYSFPLDPALVGVGEDLNIDNDFYGRFLDKIGKFVIAHGNDVDESAYANGVFEDLENMDAEQIVLYESGENIVTLKDFSDRYGLFDGIDNDGDGLIDYKWEDIYLENGEEGQDDIFETKWYDFDEADAKYGIPSQNLSEIARKMFSHDSEFTIPELLPDFSFDEDFVLKTLVTPYNNKKISSTIIHNEPTNYTIFEQAKSGRTLSLPIDDPRYIAFQSSPVLLDNNDDGVNPYYFSGATQKIEYPNLYKIDNFAQLQNQLNQKAWDLTKAPGSYRILGGSAGATDCVVPGDNYAACKEIHDEILNKYFSPAKFTLGESSTEKIYDALEWLNMSTDEKHEEILMNYLGGNDGESAQGYEAAYLVLDGGTDYFDMNFNKDIPEETDPNFSQFSFLTGDETGDEVAGVGAETGEEEVVEEEEDGFEFVDLDDFWEETQEFIKGFSSVPKFDDTCSSVGCVDDSGDSEKEDADAESSAEKSVEIYSKSDEMIADGESRMEVEAAVLGADGKLELSKTHRVKFAFEGDGVEEIISFEDGDVVKSVDGVATALLKAGTHPSDLPLWVRAVVVDQNGNIDDSYSVGEKKIYVVADEPASIKIKSDSFVLSANGQSKTTLNIEILDKFGNLANNSFAEVALFTGSKAYFDERSDANSQLIGTQLSTFEGVASVDLYSKDESGEVNVFAVLLDYENEEEFIEAGDDWKSLDFSTYVHGSREFTLLDPAKISLKITPNKTSIPADGESVLSIKIEFLYSEKVIEEYSGPVDISLLNDNFGNFVSTPPAKMTNGVLHEANVKFKASTLAGAPELFIKIPGFISDTLKFKTLPGEPIRINLTSSADSIYTSGIEEVVLEARLVDKYGNFVDTNNSTLVSFSSTDATKDFVEFFDSKSAISSNGVASVRIKGGEVSGDASLIANVENVKNFAPGILSLKVKKHVSVENVKKYFPKVLYLSLLGGSFGDLNSDQNLAQAFLHNGKLQAVSSVTATSSVNRRLISVDPFGKIEVLSDTVSATAVLATDSFPYQKIVFSDELSDEELASAFLVPKPDTDLVLLGPGYDDGENGIYVQRISEKDVDLEFIEKDDGIYIEKFGEVRAKIDKFGRIFLNDSLLELSPSWEDSGEDGENSSYSFSIYDRSELLAKVSYEQDFTDLSGSSLDVNALSYNQDLSAVYPGVYLQLNSSCDRYGFASSYSGSSSAGAKGLYLIDKENVIDLGFDDASNDFGFGFEDKNKHMLLFAAGNSVGESNVPYGSEVGIVYGDPTVRLSLDGLSGLVSTLSGYTKDIGKSIFTGSEDITKMINFDYNGNGFDDVLLIYESGFVRLLENQISNKEFKDRGYIINVFGGIFSSTRIDVDNDGDDDLVVGTKDACISGETCVNLFLNNNGHFERVNLDLSISDSEKVYEIDSADINSDGCDDLAVADFSGNFRIFYNQNDADLGDDPVCKGITKNHGYSENFGSSINFNFEDSNNDIYSDILIRPSVNTEGKMIYLNSTGKLNANGYVQFEKTQTASSSVKPEKASDFMAEDFDPADGVSPDVADQLAEIMASTYEDSDYDGCPDSWCGVKNEAKEGASEAESMATSIAEGVEAAVSSLRCSGGGCLPIPYNYAFFAPDGTSPGYPALALGTSTFPYFAVFAPTTVPSSFRYYVCPTLTMGLAMAVCAGPSTTMASPCFTYALPVQDLGVCPDFVGPVNDAIAAAKDYTSNPDIGMATVVSDGQGVTGTGAISEDFAYSDPDSPISAAGAVNIKIPGFPGAITNWIDAMTDDFYNKLLDFPDIYFIYPDVSTLVGGSDFGKEAADINSLHDVLKAINSIPLVQIEGKEILLRVPTLSKAEWIKWKRQADAWVKYEEEQLSKLSDYWSCNESEERKTLCDTIRVDMVDLIQSVKSLMEKLDQIANLPRDILTWRTMESKYATQIICYLDAVMQFTGGYIGKQEKVVESWMKAVEDATRTFKDWHVILDVVAEYQTSCDQCKNDRFGNLGMLLNLFAAIPDPPLIEFPKWPDIVFDISQIQTGVKIIWPDLVFQPEHIRLPNLPYITLPSIAPGLTVHIPGFDDYIPDWLIDFPTFTMPDIPDLPPLPIPQLPDLPRPPKIPKIDNLVAGLAGDLKTVFKILCLLKNGLIPVPEGSLATEIETLTQPTVQAVLPFIMDLGVQMPAIEYNYVEQIKVTAKLNMGIDVSSLYNAVRYGAEGMNSLVEELVGEINSYTGFPIQQVIDDFIKEAEQEARAMIIGEPEEDVEEETELEAYLQIENSLKHFESTLQEYVSNLDLEQNYPDTYNLVAEQKYLDPESPLLNRSIEEIENDIQYQILPENPEMQRLALLRDSLIEYTKNLNQSNVLLENIEDFDNFSKILVDTDQNLSKLASLSFDNTSTDTGDNIEETKTSFLGDSAEENLLLAANVNTLDVLDSLGAGASATDQTIAPATPAGLYILIENQNENVLNYTGELKRTVHTLFNDADGDGDHDLVFSLGGDVYFKENHSTTPDLPKGDLILSTSSSSVSHYSNSESAGVQGLSSAYENHEKADLSWLPTDGDVSSYEIVIRKSLLDDEGDAVYNYTVLADATTFTVEIENGNYYANVYAVDSDGKKSIVSENAILAPQACADKEAPLPAVTNTEFDLSIFKDTVIDAGSSFDTSGEVKEYFLEDDDGKILWSDLNSAIDEDGNGITWDEKNNPKFRIDPFENKNDIGIHDYILHVVDQSGNSSELEIKINVFAPDITLDELVYRTSIVRGGTEPSAPNLPFSLWKKTYIYRIVGGDLKIVPEVKKILTPSADEDGKYYTNNLGEYEITDFELEDFYILEDANGELIANINSETGNIGELKDGYSVVVNEAVPPSSSTSIDIVDSNGEVLVSIYLFANPNSDVNIVEEVEAGVNFIDADSEDEFELQNFPADDFNYPGGAALVNKNSNKRLLVVDTSGNIILLDDALSLHKKENNYKEDPVVIEILFENEIVAYVYMLPAKNDVKVLGPKNVPAATPHSPSAATFYVPEGILGKDLFVDADEELNKIVADLYVKGIVEGEETEDGLMLYPDSPVARSEYVKILLKMLCIIPRPEAYGPYTAGESGGGFSDIYYNENLPSYYPYVKEADLLGIIYGYRGEGDPETGLFPFKPDQNITRAEAVQMILEALELIEVLDLKGLEIGTPWYEPFMVAATDLTPYMTAGQSLKNNFIITPGEASNPEEELTNSELIIMTTRILDFYNCFEIDEDTDGMADFCEEKFGISDPYGDPDNDGILNTNECYYGLDPENDDSDGDGISDGDEIKSGSDPFIAEEELDNYEKELLKSMTDESFKKSDYTSGQSGLYIVPAECKSCPCPATLLNNADILPGDTLFTVISSFDEDEIFSKSNEVVIQSITK